MSREAHAPFCERPGVRFPRSTLPLDLWFEQEVKPRLRGRATLVRYCDDFVIGFEREDDARRVMEVKDQHAALTRRIQGYFNYFGVSGNFRSLLLIIEQAKRSWYE